MSDGQLANVVHVRVDTANRWVELLIHLHHGFIVRPWSKSVAKSLRKEPKWYQADWSGIDDDGGEPRPSLRATC